MSWVPDTACQSGCNPGFRERFNPCTILCLILLQRKCASLVRGKVLKLQHWFPQAYLALGSTYARPKGYILGKLYLILKTSGVFWIHLPRVSTAWRLIRFWSQTTCIQNMVLPFARCNFRQVT